MGSFPFFALQAIATEKLPQKVSFLHDSECGVSEILIMVPSCIFMNYCKLCHLLPRQIPG